MAKLTVPKSPKTYTTHYENLLGIDCFTPNTEVSNGHATAMVNMLPEGGVPVKRKGWRKIHEFDTDITTAYYDVYNDATYIATKDKVAVKSGSFDAIVTEVIPDSDMTKGSYLKFKPKNFEPTLTIDAPYKGISQLDIVVGSDYSGDENHSFTSEEIQDDFSFDASGNITIAKADFASYYTMDKSNWNGVRTVVSATNKPQDLPDPATVTGCTINSQYNKSNKNYIQKNGQSVLDLYPDGANTVFYAKNIMQVYWYLIWDGNQFVAFDTAPTSSYVVKIDYANSSLALTDIVALSESPYNIYSTNAIQSEMYLDTNGSDQTLWLNWLAVYRLEHTLTPSANGTIVMSYKTDDLTLFTITAYIKYKSTSALSEINATSPVKHIVPFNGSIYFIASDDIKILDNGALTPITYNAPITKFSLNPDGTGGQAYYSVNAMTQDQVYLFHGDGSTKKFYPHGTSFNGNGVEYIFKVKTVEVFNGVKWETKTLTTDYTITQGNANYDVLGADGSGISTIHTDYYVEFINAPADYTTNGDNVKITVEELDVEIKETVGGTDIRWGRYNRLKHKILDAEILTVYGSVDTDRIFVVLDGNKIYYSESGEINYFPDDNYIVAGNYAPIVGLHRKDDMLVAVTGESDSHAIYIIKSSTAVVTEQNVSGEGGLENTSHEEQFFSVHPAASGKGAIATNSFATLIDDPLYLGTQGVYSISSNYYTSQTMIINKSTFINPKLLAEPNLENAIACTWKHLYCIFINGHAYLFDADNVTRDSAGNRCYEAYYLENMPVTNCVMPANNDLYFANGKYWCKFNTDIEGSDAYYDDGTYDENLNLVFGEHPVSCVYETKLDDDDRPQYFKNLNKKGVVITVLAQDDSSVDVYISKNGDDYIHTEKMTNMETDGITIDVYPLKKVKKYKRLKFRIVNDKPEPFGLVKIVKTWTLGNYAK